MQHTVDNYLEMAAKNPFVPQEAGWGTKLANKFRSKPLPPTSAQVTGALNQASFDLMQARATLSMQLNMKSQEADNLMKQAKAANAKKNGKTEAKTLLIRYNVAVKSRDGLAKKLANIENQCANLETVDTNRQMVQAMKSSGAAMKTTLAGALGDNVLEDLDNLEDDISELNAVEDRLTEPMGLSKDEMDVDGQLKELDDEIADDMHMDMPVVPAMPVKVKKDDEEKDEVEPRVETKRVKSVQVKVQTPVAPAPATADIDQDDLLSLLAAVQVSGKPPTLARQRSSEAPAKYVAAVADDVDFNDLMGT